MPEERREWIGEWVVEDCQDGCNTRLEFPFLRLFLTRISQRNAYCILKKIMSLFGKKILGILMVNGLRMVM